MTENYLTLLLQALLGGMLVYTFTYCEKQKQLSRKTANYAKLLVYNMEPHRVAAKNLYQILKSSRDISPVNLSNNFNDDLWELHLKNTLGASYHPLHYSALCTLRNLEDNNLWSQTEQHFIHLPTSEFEILFYYFTKTRQSLALALSPSINPCNQTILDILTNYLQYVDLVYFLLWALIDADNKKFYHYLLVNLFFVSKNRNTFDMLRSQKESH